MERIILHSDMDRFYCAVEEKYNPKLKKAPFAVCGDPAMRHSIVMSASSLAREHGVRAGLRFADARKLCPQLVYITADMAKYLTEAKAAREVYLKYSEEIIPYGMDESWIILKKGITWQDAEQIADLIRLEIMYSMELSTSVGISYNLIFSKIGSDYQKPNGKTVITKDNFKEKVWPLDVSRLLFVGEVRKKALTRFNFRTIGDLAAADPCFLSRIIKSKAGHDLWQFANGDDSSFNPASEKIGSIGNTITPPADLNTNEEITAVMYMLASAVSARLKKHSLNTKSISISMRDNQFNKIIRQRTLNFTTNSAVKIFDSAIHLFKTHYTWENPLRSIGIRAANLDPSTQLTLFDWPERDIMDEKLNSYIKPVTSRFGVLEVEKSAGLWKDGEF